LCVTTDITGADSEDHAWQRHSNCRQIQWRLATTHRWHVTPGPQQAADDHWNTGSAVYTGHTADSLHRLWKNSLQQVSVLNLCCWVATWQLSA